MKSLSLISATLQWKSSTEPYKTFHPYSVSKDLLQGSLTLHKHSYKSTQEATTVGTTPSNWWIQGFWPKGFPSPQVTAFPPLLPQKQNQKEIPIPLQEQVSSTEILSTYCAKRKFTLGFSIQLHNFIPPNFHCKLVLHICSI